MQLQGLHVLVTRPQAQGLFLCQQIKRAGGLPWSFPTLEIQPLADTSQLLSVMSSLASVDKVVFVTANAVRQVAPVWDHSSAVQTMAIGEATARMMRECDLPIHQVPEHTFSSEGLLALPDMQQVSGQKIVLLAGEGGRRLMADTLTARGAEVVEVPVYRRTCPDLSPQTVQVFWQQTGHQIMVSISVQSLLNLHELAGSQIFSIPLLVVSQRMAAAAKALGDFVDLVVTPQVSDLAILETLKAWYSCRSNRPSSKRGN